MKPHSASEITDLDTICHQWRKRAVIVNREAGWVEFRHCHVPRQSILFPKTQPNFACSISDLRAVHFTPRFKSNSAFLTVVTTTGKANIPDTGPHFATLREWFNETVPRNDPKFATDNPLSVKVYVFFGTVCFFAAAFLTEGAGNAAVFATAVFAAILAVLGAFLVISFGGRLLHTDITYAIFPILSGIAISAAMGRYVESNVALAIGIILTLFFTVAMYRRRRRINGRTKT